MDKTQPQSSLIVEDLPALNAERSSNDGFIGLSSAPQRIQFGADAWGDSIALRVRKSKKNQVLATYIGVGISSFLLFLYLSFPFNVVKEVLVSKVNENFIQQNLPLRISVGNFSPKFPLGINLEDIQLSNVIDPAASVKIGRGSFSLNMIPLLIGKIHLEARLTQSGGSFEINLRESIASLIKLARSANARFPSGELQVGFTNFEIKPFVANALAFVKSGNNPALQTIQPFLATEISGQLSGFAKLELPEVGDSLEKANADLDLKIGKAYFEMRDETLAIPRQEFSDARIKLKLVKKSLEIPTETKIVANDIGIYLSGRMNVTDNLSINDVKLKLGLVLKGKIEENFKTLIPVILGCDLAKMNGGKMDVELNGNFSALTCS